MFLRWRYKVEILKNKYLHLHWSAALEQIVTFHLCMYLTFRPTSAWSFQSAKSHRKRSYLRKSHLKYPAGLKYSIGMTEWMIWCALLWGYMYTYCELHVCEANTVCALVYSVCLWGLPKWIVGIAYCAACAI